MVVQNRMGRIVAFSALLVVALGMISSSALAQYTVTNLVSSQAGKAQHQDTSLVNAWGISYASGGPFWVSDNATGLSTLYNAQGIKQPTVVTIPSSSGSGTGSPTGQVYNGTGQFKVTQNGQSGSALFIFATFDGTISGWSPTVNATTAVIAVNNTGAWYTGVALGVSNSANFLFAADNLHNKVDIYDSSYNLVGSFTDTSLPAGSAPYNVVNIGGHLCVTFTNGTGGGVVDIFSTAGTKIKTLISGGNLHSPWGVALAPANFGTASNALLVGNLGDGFINAFNPTTGKLLGKSAVSFEGLWSLIFGGGSPNNGNTNQLFLTSGPGGYSEGLFSVVNVK
ncbi:MAG: TIGR03118 family protein [Terriglobales bacterium]